MADKKIFISYDYDGDKHYRRLLSAWDANESFEFSFEDHSTPYINSEEAGRIKAAITTRLKGAECLLVIVGSETSQSDWVDWEIAKAGELGLSLVAVKIDRRNVSPSGLLGTGVTWAHSFTLENVTAALRGC